MRIIHSKIKTIPTQFFVTILFILITQAPSVINYRENILNTNFMLLIPSPFFPRQSTNYSMLPLEQASFLIFDTNEKKINWIMDIIPYNGFFSPPSSSSSPATDTFLTIYHTPSCTVCCKMNIRLWVRLCNC